MPYIKEHATKRHKILTLTCHYTVTYSCSIPQELAKQSIGCSGPQD